jgi:2'-hydroxyisoflavone reductase
MRILIIGGSQFIGKAILKSIASLKETHELYVFNRGNHEIENISRVKNIIGNRSDGFLNLRELYFDLVIDTCAYTPSDLKNINQLNFNKYLFISSTSIYKNSSIGLKDESSPLKEFNHLKSKSIEELQQIRIDSSTYGPLKILCEEKLKEICPNLLIVRPCVVLGKNENTGRLESFLKTISDSSFQISTDTKDLNFQFIDVRDLAFLISYLATTVNYGVFNLCAPPISWIDFINAGLKLKKQEVNNSKNESELLIPFLEYSKELNRSAFISNSNIVSKHRFHQINETLESYSASEN